MPLPLFIPFHKLTLDGFYPEVAVLKEILNTVLELDPPLPVDQKYDTKTVNALNKFKALYWSKYKQGLADYGLVHEELFVALGKELKEKNETKFNELIKKLNDSQWTLILTGKISEVRAVGKKIDLALAELFTKDAIVEGAGRYADQKTGTTKEGLGFITNHFYLKDGHLHTIHIWGDSTKNKLTGVYIPKDFSFTKYIGGKEGSATFTNTANKQVIRASHLLLIPEIQLDAQNRIKPLTEQDKTSLANQIKKSMQTAVSQKGSRYIGEIGGPGGNTQNGIHSHLTIFKDEKSMEIGLKKKYEGGALGDYLDNAKPYLGDFRLLISKVQ